MKIIKDVEAGESGTPPLHHRLAAELRPILAVHGAGAALRTGSLILARRGWNLLGTHLDGRERAGVLLFGGYATVHTASQHPDITQFAVPASLVAWSVLAWCVAPPATRTKTEPGTDPDAAAEPREELTPDTLAEAVRRVAGDRQGAHLADLLAEPELEGWEQPDLKAAITRLGVPVQEFKLRLAGRQRVRDGVRLRDLPPTPAPPAAPAAPSAGPPAPAPRPDPAPTTGPG
ncbi:hypothetical protein ABZZ79_27790 [Streptomyces sp. NPDC006458]|uniref:hypothetical protein n=1 Tax=Streptomyces sp. NPDC006458 TaxID=3154302 RepID=UPI0033AD705E